MAEAMSFLVLPPVLLLTKAREKEKTAFEAPVKSARQWLLPIALARRLTVADQFGRLVLAVCHHDESSDNNEQNGGHQVGTDVEVVRLVADVHAGDTARSVEELCETLCLLR